MVDTPVLEAGAEMRASSSLALGTKLWRRGRVAEGTSLLTKQTERFREFESHRLRQIYRGVEKLAFRQSHKLKVVGSNPTPATSVK